jgi:hypothetical protein
MQDLELEVAALRYLLSERDQTIAGLIKQVCTNVYVRLADHAIFV